MTAPLLSIEHLSVAFGPSSDQEMCYQFAFSYPARALDNGVISLIGALCALATPAVLWVRHLGKEVWPSTPRALEAQLRLRRTVLYSAATAGITGLIVQLFEVLLQRQGAGLARPGWGLFVIGWALMAGVATWVAMRPKHGKS